MQVSPSPSGTTSAAGHQPSPDEPPPSSPGWRNYHSCQYLRSADAKLTLRKIKIKTALLPYLPLLLRLLPRHLPLLFQLLLLLLIRAAPLVFPRLAGRHNQNRNNNNNNHTHSPHPTSSSSTSAYSSAYPSPSAPSTQPPSRRPTRFPQTGRVSSLTLAAWNVRFLLDNPGGNRSERRTALMARELARYKVDIAAISETRFSEQGQLEEKCQEMRPHLYSTFVDLTKAFETVNCEGLWKIMKKFGCPERFTQMVRQLHDGMMARVTDNGAVSEAFAVTNGVKQGCVLAPTLFSLMFSAMLMDAYRDERPGMRIAYRADFTC
ncbi:hypothetical protein SprV_1002837400 [Sparganum proliferum]